MKAIEFENINSILISCNGGHADSVRVTPYIRAIREKYPNARIALLTTPWGRDLYAGSPYVDEIIVLRHVDQSQEGRLNAVKRLVSAISSVRNRFDLFIGSPFNLRFNALVALFSGARYRIGYKVNGIPFAWTTDVGYPDYNTSLEARRDKIWQAIGIDNIDPRLELWSSPEDEAYVDELLGSKGIKHGDVLIGIHPGSDWGCQQWHPQNWAEIVKRIENRTGAKFIITGTEEDRPSYEDIQKRTDVQFISAVGETTIGQLGALVKRFDALITVDSLVAPFGIVSDIPVVVLNFRNPSPWSDSRWPNLISLHPPEWFHGETVNQTCRIRKQQQGLNTCRPPLCLGKQRAALISALVTANQVEKNLEPFLSKIAASRSEISSQLIAR